MRDPTTDSEPAPTLDYAGAPPAARGDPTPKVAMLCWLSVPAVVGVALMAASAYVLANRSLGHDATKNLLAALVAAALLSSIPSGAIVLAVIESRKTVASLLLMAFNLAWLAACVAWLILV